HRLDLHAAATFEPATPIPSATARFRPALEGDPMERSQRELLDGGYGMRPDPVGHPALYAAWLQSARKPIRRLTPRFSTSGPRLYANQITTDNTSGFWGGADLLQPSTTYTIAMTTFTVPQIHPQAFHANGLIWAGLGGHSSPLIQDGVGMDTTTTA